jgi:hypothetical protein
MLAPHLIPSEEAVAGWAAVTRNPELLLTAAAATGQVTNLKIADQLEQALAALAPSQDVIPALDGQPEDLAHDAYFHVKRIENDPVRAFVRMAFAARLILMLEVDQGPVTIPRSQLGFIDRALADLIACLCGRMVESARYVTDWQTRGTFPQVKPRWIHGHQIFAALTQGLIFSFQSMGHAVRAGNSQNVRRWADLSISLLRGSGAAFVLTGDFTVQDYNEIVRPSMMPPASPICLSGLMSIDHRFLVQTLRDLRPALRSLHEHEKERHDSLLAALSTVYDMHIHVCERFVGDRPSLLTAGRTEKSGPSLIEQFKALRLKTFESSPHASRLKPAPRCPSDNG